MSLYSIRNGFSAGEISPSLWGRTDLAKFALGGSTLRNCFVNYRGGSSSRAGTAYVGMTKQGAPNAGGTPTNNPPRDIPFQFNLTQGFVLEFGDYYMRIKSNGAYITEAPQNISGITQDNPGVVAINSHGYSNGDWVFGSGIGGMTELNSLTWIVQNSTTNTFTLTDLFGNPINTNLFPPYTSGGTFTRIYTLVTPYAAIDIPYLKFTQSANTMSLTCQNQDTGTEYVPYDLVRNSAANWTLTATQFASSISAPTNVQATAENSTTTNTYYSYVVTAVDATTGEESIASSPATILNNDISINAGSNTITWNAVANASSYNIYGSIPSYNAPVPAGVNYGYLGSSFGGSFVDSNIVADFNTVPPVHENPFAPGPIIGLSFTSGGMSYTQTNVGYTLSSTSGTNAVLDPIVVNGLIVAAVIPNGGEFFHPTDTIAFTSSGSGTGAAATLITGPLTGVNPGCVAYYQQRRVYGNTENDPNTYYMSQPGAYTNFDASVPTVNSDAITGTPWAQQINGIQFFQPMPGGLVVLTGSGAWQVNGGTSAAITPADQTANPQAYNGCNNKVGPIVVNYDILYVQAKGSIVRDLSYNFFVNIYTGTDLTILSNHLFDGHQILQWAYAEEPYKLIWLVRDDGVLLSLTYLKEQDIFAWTHSDTNGQFVSVCTVTELPVDAVYVIVKRYVNGVWVYYSERMDNRTWPNAESCFCVDAGLVLPMSYPSATLIPAAANGTNNISSTLQINGGSNYTNPQVQAVDRTGAGSGATFSAAVSGGVITGITPLTQGQNYTMGETTLIITDPTGSGAIFDPVITNIVSFSTSSSVFNPQMVGSIIRGGGGNAIITNYISPTQVMANIIAPITQIIPNDPNDMPLPLTQTAIDLTPPTYATWSISQPVTQISGLNHLAGLEVSILADGGVLPSQTVSSSGNIVLPVAASQVTIGLPFSVQMQTLYNDDKTGQIQTPQGRRKKNPAIVARVEASRGWTAGTNQPDASIQPNGANIPWTRMTPVKQTGASIYTSGTTPLFTGDVYQELFGSWDRKGQIAFEQNYPLPFNLLGVISLTETGDDGGTGR